MNNEKSKLVSIVIPVYNVDKYIDYCIKSLLDQTYYNIEIILVDDGSTDCSGIICDNYSHNYKNIYVIHQYNKGVSVARNIGIQKAKGEYLLFVDPDDIVSRSYVEIMVKNMEENNSDIVECAYTSDLHRLDSKDIICKKNHYKAEVVFDYMLSNKKFNGYIWNKIFKRDIIMKNILD